MDKNGFEIIPASLILEKMGQPSHPLIVAKREEIAGATRAAELRAEITGEVDDDQVNEIVRMRIELDNLYGRWLKNELD